MAIGDSCGADGCTDGCTDDDDDGGAYMGEVIVAGVGVNDDDDDDFSY